LSDPRTTQEALPELAAKRVERMERLWTPWRMSYVSGPGVGACFLCAIAATSADHAGASGSAGGVIPATAAGQGEDETNFVLVRGAGAFVLLNRYPYNSGHLMVAPYAHVGDLTQLSLDVGHELFDLTQRAVVALKGEYRPDGFNVGLNLGQSAGAGLPDHLHLHIVPRWSGDTNFMPVLGNTKVLPEGLDRTWARLKRYFDPPAP
jgi:ATP adenylyltransferase